MYVVICRLYCIVQYAECIMSSIYFLLYVNITNTVYTINKMAHRFIFRIAILKVSAIFRQVIHQIYICKT